jgi:hypothetical protein
MLSTSLRDIVYDPRALTLDVTFIASGKRYRYFDVEPGTSESLRRAFSKGAHFQPADQTQAPLRTSHQSEAVCLRPISATVAEL